MVVTRELSKSVRVIPLNDKDVNPYDVNVGVETEGAASGQDSAAVTAPASNLLLLLDGSPVRVRRVLDLATPHDAAYFGAHQVAVTEEGRNEVALVDTRSATVYKRIPLPGRPHNITADPISAGRALSGNVRLLVTMPNRRSFAWVDPGSASVQEVPLGERPHACVTGPEGVWCVTYDLPHVLLVVNDKVARQVKVGVYPHHLLLNAGGGVLVSDPQAGRIWEVNGAGEITSRLKLTRPEEMVATRGTFAVATEKDLVVTADGKQWRVPGKPHALAEFVPAAS
jgi:DNA-binding beta-propeller fold protein YncE